MTFEVKLHQLLNKKRSLAQDMLNGSGDIKPGEFAIDDVIPQATGVVFKEEYLTLDDALQMRPNYFECLVAAIWNRRGFQEVIRTPGARDDGVDVVALNRPNGELIQCKSSSVDQTSLSWEAVKEVVAGAAAYQRKYPDVRFGLACVTNQHFNPTAHRHAENNGVMLYEQEHLEQLLTDYPVRLLDVEQYLYTDWEQAA